MDRDDIYFLTSVAWFLLLSTLVIYFIVWT